MTPAKRARVKAMLKRRIQAEREFASLYKTRQDWSTPVRTQQDSAQLVDTTQGTSQQSQESRDTARPGGTQLVPAKQRQSRHCGATQRKGRTLRSP